MKKFVNIILVLFLILGLTVGLYLLQQKYSFDLRKKAGGIETSQLILEGPHEIQTNQPFDVQLILDANGDPDYTIAGADAKISFSGLKLVKTFQNPGVFDSYPGYTSLENETTISGIKNYSVDENGQFVGFSGRATMATLTFEADLPGDYNIHLVYNGETATDDSNINGFYKFGPVSIQKPVERLLIQPNSLNVRALGVVVDPVPYLLPISMTADGHIVRGDPNATVNIVEYLDFECPFCKQAAGTIFKLLQNYKGQVKQEIRHFPLDFHSRAIPTAKAFECVLQQGVKQAWWFHDAIYARSSDEELSDDGLKNMQRYTGANVDLYNKCVSTASDRIDKTINTDVSAGKQLGITGTPTFLINEKIVNGAQPYQAFKEIIDSILNPTPTPTPTSSPVNHAPNIDTSYLPSAYRDTDYNAVIESWDEDGDNLSMTASTLPEGISLGRCYQSTGATTYLSCSLFGKTNSTIADTWSVKIEVKDSKGTVTTKYLDLYVSQPQPTWVNWSNDSIKISGNIDLSIDGKKYKNMGLGASNITNNSIDIYWYENSYSNSVSIKFDHDDQYWWISNFDGKVGDKKINQIGQFYKTLLGRPFTIQNWGLPYVKFDYFNVEAFANIKFQPEFLTEVLPAGRLFGWYTAAISVEDKNLDDYNTMEFENLPTGLTLGTCATQNRQYPPTDNDENILHCLITGRPVSIGDHKLKAKIYDNNHAFISEKEFTLPIRLFSSDPPSLPELVVTKTDYPAIFMPGKKATVVTEITNMGGSASDTFNPVVSPKENMTVVPSSQNTCLTNTILNPGERCNLAYDVTYTTPGPYDFILENLVTLPITVAPPGLVPMTVTTIIPGQHNLGDVVIGKIRLMPGDGTEQNVEAQFVYQATNNNFVATLTVPGDWAGKNLTMSIKIPGRLAQRLSSSIVLDSERETPIDASSLPSPISDFNNDNKFDISDVGLALSKYTSLTSPVGSDNKIYDINGDGEINIQDIALMLSKYTKLTTNGD